MATQIKIDTTIAAPLEAVWDAYTTPAAITGWNFASDDWCCPRAESDLRVGGIYYARMEAKDGSFGFNFDAVFEEVEHQKVITLVLTDGRRPRTTFERDGRGTHVVTVFDAEEENSIELQQSGWQAILNNFRNYVEAEYSAA